MKITDVVEGYTVLPPIDTVKYQPRAGLEGPFRLRNSKVVYYDPQEGSYYDPDTDMYISYDDYKKMDEEADHNEDVGAQIADLIRKKNSSSSPVARKNIDSQIAQLKRQRDKTNEEDAYDKDVKTSGKPYDKEAAAKRAKAAALAAAKKAKEQGVTEGNNDTGVKWFDFATWALKQGDKYKDATTNHTVYKAAQKAYKAYVKSKKQGVAEANGDQVKKVFKKNGQPVGEVGIDPEASPGNGQWYMKCYAYDIDNSGYDSYEEAVEELKYCLEKGVAEGDKRPAYVVKASDKPKKIKPSMGGESPHPYQGKLVGATEAEVGNTEYQWAHGKKPSGQGSWFFVAHRGGINFSKDVEGEDYIQLHQMSYGDAKKAAIKWAKSKGHPSLFVAT